MNAQKFYYGEDIIEKCKEYQFPMSNGKRSQSEQRRIIKQITKSSNSPITKSHLSALKNITEFDQIGQEQILKRKTFVLPKEPVVQDYSGGLLSSQSKIRVIKVPFKKIQTSCESIKVNKQYCNLNSVDDEHQFLQHLFQKDQNPEKTSKLTKSNIFKHTHQKSIQSEQSIEKGLKLVTQSSFRRESQRELKDKKLAELKQYTYKLVLAFKNATLIFNRQSKLDYFLNKDQLFVGFMNFSYNLANLPLNIQGLEQMVKAPKYLIKILKPYIPQSLEKLIFEDENCQKIRQLTFQYQLYFILFNQSELVDVLTNSVVRFMIKLPTQCVEIHRQIEKIMLNKSFSNEEQQYIEQLFEKQFCLPFEQLVMEAHSFYKLQIEYEYMKQLYCFCVKVQDALNQKMIHEGNKKQVYDKGFDFKMALKNIKSKDLQHERLFSQLLPQKCEIIQNLERFETKFGRMDTISNLQREQAKLADMKHNQLYDKILSLQRQLE